MLARVLRDRSARAILDHLGIALVRAARSLIGISQPTSGDETSSRLPPASLAIDRLRIAIASRIVPVIPVPAHDASTTRSHDAKTFGMSVRYSIASLPARRPLARSRQYFVLSARCGSR